MFQALVAVFAWFIFAQAATADWDYLPKDMMISHADAIAVVSIGKVEPASVKLAPASPMTYHEKAIATVEQVLKGKLPNSITIVGGINKDGDFACVPDVSLGTGKFLVFLNNVQHDRESWKSANADLGIRQIKSEQIEWYGKTPHERKMSPLGEVLGYIKSHSQ